MNSTKLALLLLLLILAAIAVGFCAAMIVAGHTGWECWGQGNDC